MDMAMPSKRFAAILPVGPSTTEMCRAVSLFASLVSWEPDVGWCVIVEDAPYSRGLSDLALFPETCQATTIMNPRRGDGHFWAGGVATGMLVGLSWVQANTDADFALILESDALVIAPFAEGVLAFLDDHVDAGMVGTLGSTCRERFIHNFRREPAILVAYHLLPNTPDNDDGRSDTKALFIADVGRFTIDERRLFDTIRPLIATAITQGYSTSEFCQGGAQVVTRLMMDRMADGGYMERPEIWMDLPFPGDQILPLHTRAVGLRLCSCSGRGEPFALQWHGLPYTLEELVNRRHSIIHCIKNDQRYDESEIRQFFLKRALSAPGLALAGLATEVMDLIQTAHGD
jgi:hypothetical protein